MSRGLFTDEGDTYLVQILERSPTYVKIKRLMYPDGTFTDKFDEEIVSPHTIVSDRPLRDISPKYIYHFASEKVGYKPKAASFVTVGESLTKACSHGLGSGIYGLYFQDTRNIERYKLNVDQTIYPIELQNPFIIQDADHLNNLITTSMSTNRYIDKFLTVHSEKQLSYGDIITLIRSDPIDNLLILWLIVFARSRTPNPFNKLQLEILLSNYIWYYLTDSSLHDSINGKVIHELPINYIMRILGYNGLLGDDKETNSWSRGNVSYKYFVESIILEGSGARQCIG